MIHSRQQVRVMIFFSLLSTCHAHNYPNSGWGVGLSIQAKIHFQIYLTVAKVLIHSQQQVRVMIFLFSLLTVFLRYRFEKCLHATPIIMAIAVGALGVGLSILAKIHFQIHLTVAKVLIHSRQQVRVMIFF